MPCQRGFKTIKAFAAGLHHIVPDTAMNVDVQVSGSQHRAGKIEAAAAAGKLPNCPRSNLHNLSAVQQQQRLLDALPRSEQGGSSKGNHVLSRIVTEAVSSQKPVVSSRLRLSVNNPRAKQQREL